MDGIIVSTFIKWLIPIIGGAILCFIGFSIKWLIRADKHIAEIPLIKKEVKDMNNTMIKNDLSILWSQLTSKCNKIIEQQYCDIATMECVEQLYARYKELGGNHGMAVMVKQVRAICKKK